MVREHFARGHRAALRMGLLLIAASISISAMAQFEEDFEGPTTGWETQGLWHISTGSVCSLPFTGKALRFGTDGACDYGNNTYQVGGAISPSFQPTLGSMLSFRHLADTEGQLPNYLPADVKRVEVLHEYGASTVWELYGNTSDWQNSGAISLGYYDGQSIRLRFWFDSYDEWLNSTSGWWVDDILVTNVASSGGPYLAITSPSYDVTVAAENPPTFTAIANEAGNDLGASISWSSSYDGFLGTGSPLTLTGLSEGYHVITATVSGQTGTSEQSTVIIVKQQPLVTITSPNEGLTVSKGQNVTFTGTAELGDGTILSGPYRWTFSDGGGAYVYGAISRRFFQAGPMWAILRVHNGEIIGETSVNFTVLPDNGSELTLDHSGYLAYGTDYEMQGRAIDADGSDLSNTITWASDIDGFLGTGATIITPLNLGQHTITANFLDNSGATIIESTSVEVVPNTPPHVEITNFTGWTIYGLGEGIGLDASYSWDSEDGDVASIVWTSDLAGWLSNSTSEIFNLRLGLGTHTITVTGTDRAGASATDQTTVTVVDSVRPEVSITSPSYNSTFSPADLIDFTAYAQDAEDGDLSSAISWSSDISGSLGIGNLSRTLPLGTHEITAHVVDSDGLEQQDYTWSVKVINSAPTVTITSPSDGTSIVEATSLTFTAAADDSEDGDLSGSITWASSIDGNLGSGASLSTSSLSVGSHTLSASVNDSHGANAFDTITVVVTANTPPTVSITSPADGTSVVEATSLTFTATADDSEDGALSGSITWASSIDGNLGNGSTISTSSLSVGSHTLTASVNDSHGANAFDTITVVVIANTPPTVSITSPSDGTSIVEATSLTFTAAADDSEDGDLSGSITWTSSIDGNLGNGSTISTSSLSVGSHTITASVSDSHGANSSDTITLIITANTPPTVIITSPANGTEFLQDFNVNFQATANDVEDGNIAATLVWTSNLDGTIGNGASFVTTALSLGNHTITAIATDSHGTQTSTSITVIIEANQPPSVQILSPGDGTSVVEQTLLTFSGSASDVEDGDISTNLVWVSNLDGTIGGGASFNTANLSVGNHTITATVTDSYASSGSATISLTITPNTAPVVSINQPTNGTTVYEGTSLTFAGTALDAEDGDLGTAITWSSSLDGSIGSGTGFTTTALSIGTHTITAVVSDSHGAIGSATVTLSILADWAVVSNDGFENGWGAWNDGGKDTSLITAYAYQGVTSVRLRNNGAQASISSNVNLSGKNELELDFWVYANGMENADQMLVEYNDGSSWTILATYQAGTDIHNGQFTHITLLLDSNNHGFTANSALRIRNNGNQRNDQVYLDEIKVSTR